MKHDLDITRLAKLLAMTASPHDGESLNAARMASEMVLASGRTWPEVLGIVTTERIVADPAHWAEAERILASAGKGVLDGFERRFLRGILGFRSLTASQEKTLAGIARKVRASAAG